MKITLSINRRIGFKVTICCLISWGLSQQAPTVSRLLTVVADTRHFDALEDNAVSKLLNDASSLAIEMDSKIVTTKEPLENPVLQIWNEYKEQHSHQVISQEWSELKNNRNLVEHNQFSMQSRQYSIGFYSCPLQAGNRLHHFFNSLIWSVVTNRTFLYRYMDKKACLWIAQNDGGGDWAKCKVANKEKDCINILKRSEWIPSLEEWKTRLQLKNVTSFSFWSTIEKRPKHRLWHNGSERYAGIVDIRNDTLVNFAPMLGQDAAILKDEQKRKYLLSTPKAQNRAKQLLALGEDYLYGLLLEDCFQFQPSILPGKSNITYPIRDTTEASVKDGHKDSRTSVMIAVHSRHSKTKDDGSKIKREAKCLDKMLKKLKSSHDSECVIVLLSDRQNTLAELATYIARNHSHCISLVAQHDKGESWREEHGPFAGVGFYQDLGLVKSVMKNLPLSPKTQVGFVGSHHRSSSQLVREIMVYQQLSRFPEYQSTLYQSTFNETPISTCYL